VGIDRVEHDLRVRRPVIATYCSSTQEACVAVFRLFWQLDAKHGRPLRSGPSTIERALAFVIAMLPVEAFSFTESEMVAKLCAGMNQELVLPDRTRIDCLSPTHAIEVDFSEKWAEAIGQALHYSLWTAELPSIGKKRAGIILICRHARDTCTDHSVRLFRVVDAFDLPVTVWDCDVTDESLDDCQQIDR